MRDKLAEFLNKEVEFIGTNVKEINFHPYHEHSNISVLHFNDLIIAETGEKVARHFYLNKSMTTNKAQQNTLLNARSYKLDKLQELFAILKNI